MVLQRRSQKRASTGINQLQDRDGQLLKTQDEQLHRQKEHFTEVSQQRRGHGSDNGIWADRDLSNPNFTLHTPTHGEIVAALKQINHSKGFRNSQHCTQSSDNRYGENGNTVTASSGEDMA